MEQADRDPRSLDDAPRSTRTLVIAWTGNARRRQVDAVAREEPLEIRVAGMSIAVTMRTPGHDLDLVTGFLITEGIIPGMEQVASMGFCLEESSDLGEANIVNVNLYDPASFDPGRFKRNFFASSSCGVCGKATIAAIRVRTPDIAMREQISAETLYRLEERLLGDQSTFRQTGGLHAAALFDLGGRLLVTREDVGRHNAVDKVAGWAVRGDAADMTRSILLVSGRASFEVVQKALQVRIPIVVAISAPSSLAVELANSAGMTLIGFLRSRRCNIYAGAERVRDLSGSDAVCI